MSHSDSSLKVARRPAPVRSQTADVLRRAIISGRFKTGDRLNERELCELTGVSRTSVREALRILEAEGLVEATPTTGSVVATLTPKQVKDIYEFRAVLEGFGAYQFVRLASDDEIEKGLELIDAVIAAIHDPDTLREEKQRFYEFLFNIAGNNLVAETMERVSALIALMRNLTMSQEGRPEALAREMQAIRDAIAARDAGWARRAFVAHVEAAGRVALWALGELNDEGDPSGGAGDREREQETVDA